MFDDTLVKGVFAVFSQGRGPNQIRDRDDGDGFLKSQS